MYAGMEATKAEVQIMAAATETRSGTRSVASIMEPNLDEPTLR